MIDRKPVSGEMPAKRFSKLQGVAFSLPSIGVAFFLGPMGVIQGIYAKHYGIALTSIAAVLLVSRLFDAVTDPLIGYFSDKYRSRTGTRKPFVVVGALCLIPASYFLFVPPDNVNITYFAFWSLAFYLASTAYTIPHLAWASEITTDPAGRTMIFSLILIVTQVGGILFYIVPFLPIFATSEITPDTLKFSVLFGACIIVPCLYFSLKFAPSGRPPAERIQTELISQKNNFWEFFEALKSNKPFQIFVVAYMCMGLGLGMWGGLFFIYVDTFLGLGEEFAKIALIGVAGGLLTAPLCYKLVLKLGKRNTWLFSSFVILCGVGYTGMLRPEEASLIDLIILQVILTFGSVCGGIISPVMLSDTIDYGSLRDRTERNGAYFSIFSFLLKGQTALGSALGLAVAGWFGFDATTSEHSESSAFGIYLAASWIPLAITSLGLIFIWFFPLNERHNAIIRRRIETRERRRKTKKTDKTITLLEHKTGIRETATLTSQEPYQPNCINIGSNSRSS
ncbi:MFS transporter [SAR92 clade bacterium H455]|uniref:MFS transporter n=1 Tax=SAR92 clade bacterium H455 TaxID=2974818 RepID=A0ABY5TJX1_9GAMM|nr:MFS transporter [SAR92 clade bacterium H455]